MSSTTLNCARQMCANRAPNVNPLVPNMRAGVAKNIGAMINSMLFSQEVLANLYSVLTINKLNSFFWSHSINWLQNKLRKKKICTNTIFSINHIYKGKRKHKKLNTVKKPYIQMGNIMIVIPAQYNLRMFIK